MVQWVGQSPPNRKVEGSNLGTCSRSVLGQNTEPPKLPVMVAHIPGATWLQTKFCCTCYNKEDSSLLIFDIFQATKSLLKFRIYLNNVYIYG